MCDKLKNIKDQIETLSSTITDIETVLRAKDLPFLQVILYHFTDIFTSLSDKSTCGGSKLLNLFENQNLKMATKTCDNRGSLLSLQTSADIFLKIMTLQTSLWSVLCRNYFLSVSTTDEMLAN